MDSALNKKPLNQKNMVKTLSWHLDKMSFLKMLTKGSEKPSRQMDRRTSRVRDYEGIDYMNAHSTPVDNVLTIVLLVLQQQMLMLMMMASRLRFGCYDTADDNDKVSSRTDRRMDGRADITLN